MAVEAINRRLALVLMTSGDIVPVANWLDDDGDDCGPDDARFAIVGPASDGRWHTLDLTDFVVVNH